MAGFMADTLNTKTVAIEPEMLDMIAELDEFKGAWRALSTLAPERLSALRRVATIESIGVVDAHRGQQTVGSGRRENPLQH